VAPGLVRNTCYDWLRKHRRATLLTAPEEFERRPDPAPGPEAEQLRLADARMVQEGLASLPAEYREALVLRELEGMPYREIAQVTGVPIGTVMSRLARGRKRLGEAIKEKSVGVQ
jgi:RNA polymerase sigma-70 factor (ECF subfamily)